MSDSAEVKRARRSRRPDPIAMRRSALERIGAELDGAIPPPVPPGLGEGMLQRAALDGTERDRQIAGLLGQLLERSSANGDQIDGIRDQVNRMDEKIEQMSRRLEGVAYRRDIEAFMQRGEIETKIRDAVKEAREDARAGLASVKEEIGTLRKVGWGLVCVTLVGTVSLLAKVFMAAAHIAT